VADDDRTTMTMRAAKHRVLAILGGCHRKKAFFWSLLCYYYYLRSKTFNNLALKIVLKYFTFYLLVNNNTKNEMGLLSLLDVVIFNEALIDYSHTSI
jgi:hypothetical protein